MIKIEIDYIDNEIFQLVISGHSGYAEAGSDIVCAGISALTQTIGNELICECEEFVTVTEEIEGEEQNASILIRNDTLKTAYNKESILQKIIIDTLLKTLTRGYKSIQQQFPENVLINENYMEA